MKRKDIVSKLMTEGFSEKTLAGMTDRQLVILKGKILPEQYTTTTTAAPGSKVLIPQNSPTAKKDIDTAKSQRKTIETYEQEEKGKEPKKVDEKETIIKRCKHTIEHSKDKGKVEDAKKLLAKLTNKKKEVAEGEFKSKTEWLKSKGILKDKKETTESSDVEEPDSEEKKTKKKSEKKETGTKGDGGAEYEKRLAKGNLGFGLNEWVNDVVGAKVHPFTSKTEIMELIQAKLTEQKEFPDTDTEIDVDTDTDIDIDDPFRDPRPDVDPNPKAQREYSSPEIEVEPDTETEIGIDPDDPFRDPRPDVDPNPKAKGKNQISAEVAKNKIIDLMKKML
jgi:hypothetical protein